MSGVRRKGRDLRSFAKGLQQLPRVAAVKVAGRSAADLTGALTGSFDAGLTCFDDARPLGSRGDKLTLVETGTVRALLRFVYDGGTRLRAALSTGYAKYLIRFGLLPRGGDAMPARWLGILDRNTAEGLTAEVDRL